MTRKTSKTKISSSKEPGAVLCAGLFFVVTGETAVAHILSADEVTSFYAGTRYARDSRDPETSMLNLVQRTFRQKDASFALPAGNLDALVCYMDTYTGPAEDSVKRLAASWVAGVPFSGGSDSEDGGARDRMPEPPTPPPTPVGTQTPDTIKPSLEPQQAPDALTLDGLLALCAKK